MNTTSLYMRALCLIYIFLCVQFSSNANHKDADSLFIKGNFEKAAILYEKNYFLSKSTEDKKRALLYKSYCYKSLGEFEHARNIIKRGVGIGKKDSIEYLLRYEAVINSYLSGNADMALSEIKLIEYYFPEKSKQDLSITLFNILILNDQAEWAHAKQLLLSKASVLGISAEETENLYTTSENTKLKNPNKAFALSLVLPGTGQMYAGKFGRGLISLMLQTGTMIYGINGLTNGYFFTGGIPGLAAFNSFYMGGAEHSKVLVDERNDDIINSINIQLNKKLISVFEN